MHWIKIYPGKIPTIDLRQILHVILHKKIWTNGVQKYFDIKVFDIFIFCSVSAIFVQNFSILTKNWTKMAKKKAEKLKNTFKTTPITLNARCFITRVTVRVIID